MVCKYVWMGLPCCQTCFQENTEICSDPMLCCSSDEDGSSTLGKGQTCWLTIKTKIMRFLSETAPYTPKCISSYQKCISKMSLRFFVTKEKCELGIGLWTKQRFPASCSSQQCGQFFVPLAFSVHRNVPKVQMQRVASFNQFREL